MKVNPLRSNVPHSAFWKAQSFLIDWSQLKIMTKFFRLGWDFQSYIQYHHNQYEEKRSFNTNLLVEWMCMRLVLRRSLVWSSSAAKHSFMEIGHEIISTRVKQNSLTFHWLFPDQIQFFTDQNTAVLRPIFLFAADKWQSPFTSSLKCTSLILQMKEIKSLNGFLAQNVLKLTSFHSFEQAKRAREKIRTFFTFQVVKIPATTHYLGQNFEIPCLFPDFLGI